MDCHNGSAVLQLERYVVFECCKILYDDRSFLQLLPGFVLCAVDFFPLPRSEKDLAEVAVYVQHQHHLRQAPQFRNIRVPSNFTDRCHQAADFYTVTKSLDCQR